MRARKRKQMTGRITVTVFCDGKVMSKLSVIAGMSIGTTGSRLNASEKRSRHADWSKVTQIYLLRCSC